MRLSIWTQGHPLHSLNQSEWGLITLKGNQHLKCFRLFGDTDGIYQQVSLSMRQLWKLQKGHVPMLSHPTLRVVLHTSRACGGCEFNVRGGRWGRGVLYRKSVFLLTKSDLSQFFCWVLLPSGNLKKKKSINSTFCVLNDMNKMIQGWRDNSLCSCACFSWKQGELSSISENTERKNPRRGHVSKTLPFCRHRGGYRQISGTWWPAVLS